MHQDIKQRIDTLLSNLTGLPSIPDVVTKIINMVNDPNVDFKRVASEIATDQSITTNVLKLANSAYYSKGKEIESVEKAIVTLGIREVKDIVVVASTKQILDRSVIGYDLAKGDLWKHNVAVAMLAKKIALDKKMRQVADIVFTGGIIHDVGKTVIAIFVAHTFAEILALVQSDGIPFPEAERRIMGYDHQEIGQFILKKWKFPEVLENIVRYHHNPSEAPEQSALQTSIVHVANIICQMAGIGIGGDGLYHTIDEAAVDRAGLTEKELEHYYETIPELLSQARQIL